MVARQIGDQGRKFARLCRCLERPKKLTQLICLSPKGVNKQHGIIGTIHISVWPIHKPQRVFGGEAAGVGVVDAMAVVEEAEGVAYGFAGGGGDAVEVGASLGADAAEGGVGVGLDGCAALVRQRGDGTEAVGMEDLPLAWYTVDEGNPLDGLVQPRRIHPRPNHLIARISSIGGSACG